MSHRCNHRHGCHHRNEEQSNGAGPYPGQIAGPYYNQGAAYGAPYGVVQTNGGGFGPPQPYPYAGPMQTYSQGGQMQEINALRADEQRHKTNEHRSEALVLGATAVAAYEHHEGKTDPEHADRHTREERLAEATAVGAGGFALYEHEKSRHDKHQLQELGYDQRGNEHEKKHGHHHRGRD